MMSWERRSSTIEEARPTRAGFHRFSAGDITRQSLAEVYCQSPLFVFLGDSSRLNGKCGRWPRANPLQGIACARLRNDRRSFSLPTLVAHSSHKKSPVINRQVSQMSLARIKNHVETAASAVPCGSHQSPPVSEITRCCD